MAHRLLRAGMVCFRPVLFFALSALICRAAEPALVVPAEFIFGLPKAELHIHFEGTIEPEQYIELVQRNQLKSPYATAAAMRERLMYTRDLLTFIEVYREVLESLRTEKDFHDIALTYFKRVRAQNVLHVEMFFDPQMHTSRGISLATVFAGLDSARREAEQELGMTIGYIMCFNRDRSAESAMETLEASRPWLDRLVGVGLDNPEENNFTKKFQPVFARAKELGLRLTTHCDVGQANTVAHHWGAINDLGVERIDHGLGVIEDPALIALVRDRQIGLTACPTLMYRDIPGRMAYRAGAIKQMLEAGLLVSVHSDDPGMKRGLYISDLLVLVQKEVGLTREQIITLARNSLKTAWVTDARRRELFTALDNYLAANPG